MKNYTVEQLQQNYDKFIDIKKVFKGERLEKLLHMYSEKELGTELTLDTAVSGRLQFHSITYGGYIDHVLNVNQRNLI